MPGRLLVGFQDDPSLRWGADRASMLDRARRAGATVIRTTVDWSDAAPRRPSSPRSPFDPVYRLDDVDDLARQSQLRGMELLITIWGTPEWANGGQERNHAPERPDDLADFAQALADRYSERHPGYPASGSSPRGTSPISSCFWHRSSTPRAVRWRPAAYATHCRSDLRRGQAWQWRGPRRDRRDPSARGRDIPASGPARRATPRERSPGSWRTRTESSRSMRGRSTRIRRGRTTRPPSPCTGRAWA